MKVNDKEIKVSLEDAKKEEVLGKAVETISEFSPNPEKYNEAVYTLATYVDELSDFESKERFDRDLQYYVDDEWDMEEDQCELHISISNGDSLKQGGYDLSNGKAALDKFKFSPDIYNSLVRVNSMMLQGSKEVQNLDSGLFVEYGFDKVKDLLLINDQNTPEELIGFLKNAELEDLLEEKGLNPKGKKQEKIDKLLEAGIQSSDIVSSDCPTTYMKFNPEKISKEEVFELVALAEYSEGVLLFLSFIYEEKEDEEDKLEGACALEVKTFDIIENVFNANVCTSEKQDVDSYLKSNDLTSTSSCIDKDSERVILYGSSELVDYYNKLVELNEYSEVDSLFLNEQGIYIVGISKSLFEKGITS